MKNLPKGVTKVGPVSWDELWHQWGERESQWPHWKELWTERGFKSWQEWRTVYVKRFGLDEKDWILYKIDDPKETVPGFYGGPFSGWIRRWYGDQSTMLFSEIAMKRDEDAKHVKEGLDKDVPSESTILGVVTPDGHVTIVEGMSRCLYAAWAAKYDLPFEHKLNIAIAYSDTPLPERVGGQMRQDAVDAGLLPK